MSNIHRLKVHFLFMFLESPIVDFAHDGTPSQDAACINLAATGLRGEARLVPVDVDVHSHRL